LRRLWLAPIAAQAVSLRYIQNNLRSLAQADRMALPHFENRSFDDALDAAF
jgi:hypothetical protein